MASMVLTAVLAGFLSATPAPAQTAADVAERAVKEALAAEAGPSPLRVRSLVMPSFETRRGDYLGFRLILGGLYYPAAYPDETWVSVACVSQDPRVPFDGARFGSSLVYVDAYAYEMNQDGTLDTWTMIDTAETYELDEGVCDLSYGVDTTFISIPRTFDVAVVSLWSVPGNQQYVEVVENVERMLTR